MPIRKSRLKNQFRNGQILRVSVNHCEKPQDPAVDKRINSKSPLSWVVDKVLLFLYHCLNIHMFTFDSVINFLITFLKLNLITLLRVESNIIRML